MQSCGFRLARSHAQRISIGVRSDTYLLWGPPQLGTVAGIRQTTRFRRPRRMAIFYHTKTLKVKKNFSRIMRTCIVPTRSFDLFVACHVFFNLPVFCSFWSLFTTRFAKKVNLNYLVFCKASLFSRFLCTFSLSSAFFRLCTPKGKFYLHNAAPGFLSTPRSVAQHRHKNHVQPAQKQAHFFYAILQHSKIHY